MRSWSEWRGGRHPKTEERVTAVEYYADNDACLPATHPGRRFM